MAEKNLESFKIRAKQRLRVHAFASDKQADTSGHALHEGAHPEVSSTGFERIEALLDKEEPEAVSETLTKILEDLHGLATEAKTPKVKASVKKAQQAVERTMDLVDYLFRVKQALIAQNQEASSGGGIPAASSQTSQAASPK